jgi:hypothetical protein
VKNNNSIPRIQDSCFSARQFCSHEPGRCQEGRQSFTEYPPRTCRR